MTYKRNIQYLIDLCKANGVELILSTYCHFLYEKIKNETLHLTFHSIVNKENEIIRGLAKKNNLILIDNSILVPADEEYFVDSIHFTPRGMKLLARNIADVILKTKITCLKCNHLGYSPLVNLNSVLNESTAAYNSLFLWHTHQDK